VILVPFFPVKPLLTAAFVFSVVALLGACSTLSNRRDLYTPQTTQGPYTKMLKGQK